MEDSSAVSSDDDSSSFEEENGSTDISSGEGTGDETDASRKEQKEIENMIRKETKYVWLWRVVVAVILALTAAAVATTTNIFLSRDEMEDFETGVSVLGLLSYSNVTRLP